MSSIGFGKTIVLGRISRACITESKHCDRGENQLHCCCCHPGTRIIAHLAITAAGTVLPNLGVPIAANVGAGDLVEREGGQVIASPPTWASDRQAYQLRYTMYVSASLRDGSIDWRHLVAVPGRHSSGSMTLAQERLSRRPSFREGVKIRLADNQIWTLPAPPKQSEAEAASFGTEYTDIIQALMDVTDGSDQCHGELALAIYLLGYNYCLTPPDYESLLGFTSESPDATAAQSAFHRIAQEHLHSFLDASGVSWDNRTVAPKARRLSRLIAWLRIHLPFGLASVGTRSY